MTTAPKRQPIPFGKYLLLDRVNIGGMAEVWRAKTFGAGGFERLVAIKRILPNIAEDEEFISMFIDEAKITVQLAHANIAQIYELSHLSNSYFIAMEYVSGKDMRGIFDRCRKRGEPAPIPLVCHLIARCCEGLDYAHRKKDGRGGDLGIVHRDVSPANALISYDGEVKVIDFGIAKAAGKATKTQAGILKGKFGYMSPEQIRGMPLDRRSDVFAIGVCLFEMLTGERLFVGESDFSVLEKVRKVEMLPPSHFNRKIPDQLEKIVMKALAKEVDERYQWATELSEDLNRFIYSTGQGFGRMELAAFMKSTFAEDFEKEKQRIQEYGEVKATEGMIAALEMGLAAPVPPLAPPVAPPAAAGRTQGTAPPVMRSVSQTLAPVTSAPVRSVSVPRLAAVSPAKPVVQEEQNSTVMMDSPNIRQLGDPPAPSAPPAKNRERRPVDEGAESSTDAALPALKRQELLQEQPITNTNPALVVAPGEAHAEQEPAAPLLLSQKAKAAAKPGSSGSSAAEARSGGSFKVAVLVVVTALVLVAGGGAAFVFWPKPKGLVMIDVPPGLEGKVRLKLNSKEVREDDGSPLKDWPQIREVPAGKATVWIKAEGYDVLVETIDVKEGNDVSHLTTKLKKSGETTP